MLRRSAPLIACVAALLTIGFTISARAGSATGTIRGMVLGTGGAPAADVQVKLFAAPDHAKTAGTADAGQSDAQQKHHHRQALTTTTTDNKGHFAFADLAPGRYVVTAAAKGQGHGQAKVSLAPGGIASLDITLKSGNSHKGKG